MEKGFAMGPPCTEKTSLWLHNKLGTTSNDSWTSGSICSQLNKEVLRNIKECFPDLQTQVKLKLLLTFFHIPRRLIEEWKTELEEVIEVAALDSELWVSMLAEMVKTFPATSSLNTEISDYEDTRPIFTDMVSELRKLVNKHHDLGMLPLECQYLNKNALISVVGQQPNPVKHFTLKRKPKSAQLRTELLHKSADAQSSLKKTSAPTIPLRSRGMPRKMTDTTPLKGIPSRVPTSGFRSPNVATNSQQRPNLSRTPAGRKDGGIKLIEFQEQPLGYAAAKKRKREQQLEEQQRKQEQKQAAAAMATGNTSPSSPPPSLNTSANADTPTTPTSANNSIEIKSETPTTHNQNELNDSQTDTKNILLIAENTKSEPESSTPEYAPTLVTYTQQQQENVATTVSIQSTNNNNQTPTTTTTTAKARTPRTATKRSAAAANASAVQQQQQQQQILVESTNNNNNQTQANNQQNTPIKRIKQEIEIKSEEILVPATIKLEKIENQSQTVVKSPQKRAPQRITIQQAQTQTQSANQQQQSHVLIRNVPLQQQQQTQQQQPMKQTIGNVTVTRNQNKTPIKVEKLESLKPLVRSSTANAATTSTILTAQQLRQTSNPLANLPNNISVKITSTKANKTTPVSQQSQQQQQQPILINSSTPVILSSSPSTQTVRQVKQTVTNVSGTGATTTNTNASQTMKSLSQLKNAANSGPVIISQTIIQPAKRTASSATTTTSTGSNSIATSNIISQQQQQQQQQPQPTTQYILTSAPQQHTIQQQNTSIPALTTYTQGARPITATIQQQPTTLYQTSNATSLGGTSQTPTKILLKTASGSSVMMTPMRQQQQNISQPPPLIATSSSVQQPTMLSIQNVQLPNRPVTIQPASQAAQQQHLQAQLQQQPQQHTIVANTTATQQPKLTQVVMQTANPLAGNFVNVTSNAAANANKNKTIILAQKGVILRNIGGDMYQQIPISNVSNLQSLTGSAGTTLMTTAAGPPSLVKTTSSLQPQTITIQQPQQQQYTKQQIPTLIQTTNTMQTAPQTTHMIVQQQPTQTSLIGSSQQQTIIRPVVTNVSGGLTTLPQGLTLIQRPGQQPQLVQVQAAPTAGGHTTQGQQIQRTIITQQPVGQQQQTQQRPQQIVLQHKQQPRIITTTGGQQIQIQQQNNPNIGRTTQIVQVQPAQQQVQQQPPQRKGLSLSNEHVHKAHEMFRKANRVSRPDKALILGFMAGLRENPRPNSENVIVIKLGETEEKVQQEDGSTSLCLVESLIRLDYNTGEWKTFQNYRRLDQSSASVSDGSGNSSAGVMTQQNAVVI